MARFKAHRCGFFLFVASAALGSLTVWGSDSQATAPTKVGASEVKVIWRNCLSVDVKGHTAFLAAAGKGLLLLDSAQGFRQQRALERIGGVSYVRVWGDRAYVVATEQRQVYALDVANPRRPRVLGSVPFDYFVEQMALSGKRLYVACGREGLKVLDVSRPSHLKVIGSVAPLPPGPDYGAGPKPKIMGVAALGSIVYLPDGRVFQMRDPAHPQLVGKWASDGSNGPILRVGNRLIVRGGTSEHSSIEVFDLSDPTRPRRVGQWEDKAAHSLGAFTARGEWIYALVRSVPPSYGGRPPFHVGLHVLRLKDSGALKEAVFVDFMKIPLEKASKPVQMEFYDLAVDGRYAYMAAVGGGLHILDISPLQGAFSRRG